MWCGSLLLTLVAGLVLSGCGGGGGVTAPEEAVDPPPTGSKGSAITGSDGQATVTLGTARIEFEVTSDAGVPLRGVAVMASVGESVVIVAAADTTRRYAPEIGLVDKTLFSTSSRTTASQATSPENVIIAAPLVAGAIKVLTVLGAATFIHEWFTEPPEFFVPAINDNGIAKRCLVQTDLNDWIEAISFANPVGKNFPNVGFTIHVAKQAKGVWIPIDAVLDLITQAATRLNIFKKDHLLGCWFEVGDDLANIDVLSLQEIQPTGLFVESGRISGLIISGPSDLYHVEPFQDGEDTRIGTIETSDGTRPVITDLAFSARSGLFGISFTTLYRIDRLTATATLVGELGESEAVALEFSEAGQLFGATTGGWLLEIDLVTGRALRIGQFGAGLATQGDIAFLPDGRLVGTLRGVGESSLLVQIDPASGAVSPVGAGQSIGFENVWGLDFAIDESTGSIELFGVTASVGGGGGQIIRIDQNTGQGTVVRNLNFDAFGASASNIPIVAERSNTAARRLLRPDP